MLCRLAASPAPVACPLWLLPIATIASRPGSHHKTTHAKGCTLERTTLYTMAMVREPSLGIRQLALDDATEDTLSSVTARALFNKAAHLEPGKRRLVATELAVRLWPRSLSTSRTTIPSLRVLSPAALFTGRRRRGTTLQCKETVLYLYIEHLLVSSSAGLLIRACTAVKVKCSHRMLILSWKGKHFEGARPLDAEF